jgi:NAD(P)-dependent dehydrogenase (short-subunit alcohol dehydrogenase family)
MAVSSEQVALVTGANRGIGLGVTQQLARLGFTVILGSRDSAKGEEAVGEVVEAGLRIFPKRLDVTDQKRIEELKSRVEERFGRLDVLVNNAAILYDCWQRATDADLNTVREAFETNTVGSLAHVPGLYPAAAQEQARANRQRVERERLARCDERRDARLQRLKGGAAFAHANAGRRAQTFGDSG